MSFNKNDLVIALLTVVIGAIITIIVGLLTHDATLSVLTSFASLIVGLFIDLRVNQHELARKPELPLVSSYSKLSNDTCQLFRKVAIEKYSEVDAFFANLMHDVIEVDSLNRVYELLEFLFSDLQAIKEIHATSYGELSEWRDAESWWGGHYLRIHDAAYKRGARITRTIIFDSDQERTSAKDILEGNVAHKVTVKTVLTQQVSSADLERVGNCLIFSTTNKEPMYCLVATHTKEGRFVRAHIYRDQEHLKAIVEAHNRIEGAAMTYQSKSKLVAITTKLN